MRLWEPGSHMTGQGGRMLLLPFPSKQTTDWPICLSHVGRFCLLLSGERLGLYSPLSLKRVLLAL